MNTESNTRIQIVLDKNKTMTVQVEKAILPEAIQLCLAAIEALCKQTLSKADTPELKQSLEEDMYEMINLGASTLLDKMFPHISMRPDLTVDAIMQAEDELLTKEENITKYSAAYDESAQSKKDVYEHAITAAELQKQSSKKKKK